MVSDQANQESHTVDRTRRYDTFNVDFVHHESSIEAIITVKANSLSTARQLQTIFSHVLGLQQLQVMFWKIEIARRLQKYRML